MMRIMTKETIRSDTLWTYKNGYDMLENICDDDCFYLYIFIVFILQE